MFADVLGVVRLPAPDVQSYLARAVEFANQALAGNLGAMLLSVWLTLVVPFRGCLNGGAGKG